MLDLRLYLYQYFVDRFIENDCLLYHVFNFGLLLVSPLSSVNEMSHRHCNISMQPLQLARA